MAGFINVTQKQAYKIISAVLKKKKFKINDIIRTTKISKAWVYRIINRLKNKGFVKKINSEYLLQNPGGLIGLFDLARSMEDNKIASLSINTGRKTVMKELAKRKVIFCLSTALKEYSEYFDDPAINFYTDDKKLIEDFKAEPKGYTQINIYKPDMFLETETEKKGKKLVTSRIRTIIDLTCNEQTYAIKALMQTEFGERIG